MIIMKINDNDSNNMWNDEINEIVMKMKWWWNE